MNPPPQASDVSPWWAPHRHADRRPRLVARARIKAAARAYFAEGGFLEAEPAALGVSPGNEAHLAAFATEWVGPDGGRAPLYLHTSPEFALKKLVAAGEPRLVAFAPVYRNRERGPLHHPEFTMAEWYRAGEGPDAVERDCLALLALAAQAAGTDRLTFRGRRVDPGASPLRIGVAEAFAAHAGIDLPATIAPDGLATDAAALAAGLDAAGMRRAPDDTWSDLFSRVLVARVEPALARERVPVVLHDYPAPEAALARRSPGDPRVAERFELYACGVELANGFGELTDPVEQRRRLVAEMAERARLYADPYPLDEDFLAALAIMPEASGVALGFDRLVMLATAAPTIDDVLWTPLPGRAS